MKKKLMNLLRWARLWLILRELRRMSRERARTAAPLFALCLALAGCIGNEPTANPVVVVLRDGLPVCSGFAVDKGRVLTAGHCVGDHDQIAIVTEEQWNNTASGSSAAEVLYRDPTRDLVCLSGEFNFGSVLKLREPEFGEAVFANSAYFGRMSFGHVLDGAGYFRDTTITVAPGWSGSPVLGGDGRVVGLVHSCLGWDINGRRSCAPRNAAITVLP